MTRALLAVAASLLAQVILSSTVSGASVLVLEPPRFCIEALARAAKSQNVRTYFATVHGQSSSPDAGAVSWIRLHPQETDSGLKCAVPADLSAFYDFSTYQGAAGLSRRLTSSLPPSCFTCRSVRDLIQDVAAPINCEERHEAEHILLVEQVVMAAAKDLTTTTTIPPPIDASVVPVSQITTSQVTFGLSTVIDWKVDGLVPARVRAIDAGKLFVDDKTYLLAGLAGDLGRSLARWMITRGARHIVMCSRHPQAPDPRWIKHVEKLGGDITVLPMDLSNEESVDAGLAELRQTLPPIGGIAFGPMVLQDALLKDMDLYMMEMAMNPKVEGARLLNARFSDPANPLDFFVMFSSIVAVTGNPGQTNYTAANAYLQAIAQQRRANGLAGSTIDIGAVFGVGYLNKSHREEEFQGVRFQYDMLAEYELHTLFAEAVVSGRRSIAGADGDSIAVTDMSDIEITTGIHDLDPVYKGHIKFFDDPRVGNLRVPDQQRGKRGNTSASKGSVNEQLVKATTMDEVRQIVLEGLSDKLRGTLQIPAEEDINPTIPLIDRGIDSLGAMTVTSWFSKQLCLNVPILSILGGASIADLAQEAAGRLPPSAIPLVESADRDAASEPANSNQQNGLEPPYVNLDSGSDTYPTGPLLTDEVPRDEPTIVRQEPLSLGQEYSWKLQMQHLENPTIFNNTIGMFIKGNIDLGRLTRALNHSLSRHEIFRTAFFKSQHDSQPVQAIMKAPTSRFRVIPVADLAAAEEGFRQLERARYDIAAGETLKLVDFYWSGGDQHLLVIAYYRLVGDGSTTENLFAEATQLYNGANLSPPPQFSSLAERQRSDLESGRMDADIAYWESMYRIALPAVLPVMPLPQAQRRRAAPITWEQHTASARLNPMVALRVKERSRQHKATPMQFYLAAYNILLARLTGSTDIVIGIADTNRSTVEELSAMGFFANLLPVRMPAYSTSETFGDEFTATKEVMRQAMQHARVPYGVTLERLGLLAEQSSRPSEGNKKTLLHAPLFQAVFDYRQGQAESGTIGGASIVEVVASRERTPYDVVLEMSDDPTRDPLITVKLQSSLYGPLDPQAFVDEYLSILASFSMNPALRVNEARLVTGD